MIRRFAFSVLAAVGLGFTEVLLALAVNHRRVASVWELDAGIVAIAPTLIVAAALLGLLGGCIDWLLSRPTAEARPALAVLLGLAGAAVGWGVGGGRHLASLGARGGFALLVALLTFYRP